MYALKPEEFVTNNLSEEINKATVFSIREGINENINESYDFSFAETADELSDQITTLAGQINAATYRFLNSLPNSIADKHGQVMAFVHVPIG